MDEVTFTAGMKLFLWVWDTGEREGFSVYVNDILVRESTEVAKKYPIEDLVPGESWGIVVRFSGKDGGATKIVDEAGNPVKVLAWQDEGMVHGYLIKGA